ncbi:MAG: class I SAM-dependent methyltransferase [Marinilabiliales bacterium]
MDIQINDNDLNNYILNHIIPEEEILKALDRETNIKIYHPRMLSGHLQGKILYMICKMINPENILEIGTYTGYSAISMAYALNNKGKLYTIEINDELYDFTKSYILKSGVSEKIIQFTGDAREIIPQFDIDFDMVFIDGNKREYPDYYYLVIDKIRPDGFIIADNTLWGGKVIKEKIRNNDYDTKGIIEFNKIVKNDKRVEQVILPIRDGISIIRKIT